MENEKEIKMELLREFGETEGIGFCREAFNFITESDNSNIGAKHYEPGAVQAVDLGLPSGRLWADRNIGARSPEDVGLYFSWGNVEGVEFGKDYGFSEEHYNDTPGAKLKGDIDAEHDAATVNLGAPWHMPTEDDFVELVENCESEFCSVNGYRGYKFTSKINGKSIFFAASGIGDGSSWDFRGSGGFYWSASFVSARDARHLDFYSGGVYPQDDDYRHNGFAVRPVQ